MHSERIEIQLKELEKKIVRPRFGDLGSVPDESLKHYNDINLVEEYLKLKQQLPESNIGAISN